MLNNKKKLSRPIKLLIAVIVSIFSVHFGIFVFMKDYFGLQFSPVQGLNELFDSVSLIIFIAPILYYILFRPLVGEIDKHEAVEDSLRISKLQLEQANRDLSKFKLALDNTSDRVTITDPEGIVIYCNPATEKITGYKAEEIIGRKAGALWHLPMPKEYYKKLWDTISNKKEPFRGELQNRRRNGEVYDAVTNISPVLDEKRNVVFFVEVERDVTESKRAEEALRKQEALFDTLTQYSPDCIKLFDTEGKLMFINKEGIREHGYKNIDEALKRGLEGILEGMTSESATAFKKAFAAALHGKVASAEIEHTIEGSDREFCLESVTPIRDNSGKISGIIGISRDVSEHRKEEEILRRSEERLRLEVANMPIGYIAWDKDFRVVTWNPAAEKIFGFTFAEAKGKHPYDFIVPQKEQPQVDDIWRRLLAGDVSANSVNENTTKDGRTIICDWINTPLKQQDGAVLGVMSMVQDVTKAKELDKVKADFLMLASHQLRTPLSGTRWLIETLQKPFVGKLTVKQKEYLDELYKVNDKMLRLVNDLLNLLRLESGELAVKTRKFPVSELSDEIIALMESAAKTKGVKLEKITGKENKIIVKTDFEIAKNILEAFVSNAIEYSHSGQKIYLGAEEKGGNVVISVKDNGIGIPKDEQKRIFERFYRASNAKSVRPSGTGLGLSTAFIFAQKIGAKLSFESKEEKGSVFYLSIPGKDS